MKQIGDPLTRQQLRSIAAGGSLRITVACTRPVSPGAIERALHEVIDRHEALRTVFVEHAEFEQPRQFVEPREKSNVIDAQWVVRDDFVSELVLTVPSANADRRSLLNIVAELDALLSKRSVDPSPAQYLQYAEWQAGLLETAEALDGKAFWRGELEAFAASSAKASAAVPREVDVLELDRRALEAFADLRTVVAGLWALALWRTTNQKQVAFALAHDARCFEELKGAVGPFVQHLPAVISVEPELRARAYFRKLEKKLTELDAQHPFIETLGTSREPIVVDTKRAVEVIDLGALELTLFASPHLSLDGAQLLCTATKTKLALRGDRALLDCMRALAAHLVRAPDTPLGKLDAAPPELRAALEARARGISEPPFASLVDCVFAHAAQTPDAVALVTEDRQLSYAGLARRIERLSAHIAARARDANALAAERGRAAHDAPAIATEDRQRGLAARIERLSAHARVRREAVVAIVLEEAIDIVPVMLGAWHAGAAFSVLDAQWPAERIEEALAALRPAAVIGARELREALALRTTAHVDARPLHPHQLAYVVFTSATSGPPKGVMVEHRQIFDYSAAIAERFRFQRGDRHLAVTTLSADLAYTVLFPALLAGGCLHFAPRARAIDPTWLEEIIHRWGIDVLKTVPSHLSALLARGARLCPQKLLVLGGESVPAALLEKIRAWPFVNHYGPAETAVGVFAEDPGVAHAGATVPLGRELPHVHAYVRAAGRQLAPQEVEGELIIGGYSVTRGYLGRPGDTAAKYSPDEISVQAGARAYETGDRVRRGSDGAVHFLGRKDGQLKVRGYRVETREVIDALTSHPAIAEAFVVRGEEEGALAAYAVVDARWLESVREEEYRKWSENWRRVFENAYADPAGGDLSANSWKSSYTGEAMSELEVGEQIDGISSRIRAWNPASILEIGCGTGMLLLELAPHCERYVGTDFSSSILDYTRGVVARAGLANKVELIESEAHEFEKLGTRKFDVILLNSVIQYFPDTEYFERVMELAQRRLTPGGKIFIGDIRDRRLVECLHASVEHFRSAPAQPIAKWARKARQRIALDGELTFEPNYFLHLADRLEEVRHAEITLKRGFAKNELACFRFDVVLFHRAPAALASAIEERAWTGALALDGERALIYRGIPNARLIGPVWLAKQLADGSGDVASLTQEMAALEPGVEPEQLFVAARALGYRACSRASLDRLDRLDRFDALFLKEDASAPEFDALYRRVPVSEAITSPLLKQVAQTLAPELKKELERRLPEYMVPSSIALIAQVPVTSNGKLDLARLPRAIVSRLASDQEYVEPAGAIERTIAGVCEEILGVDRAGANDDFFALGGHSLLATEVVARLQAVFQVQIPLASFFGASPTVRGVAKVIVEGEAQAGRAEAIAALWEEVHAMSEAELDARLEPTFPLSDSQRRVLQEFAGDAAHPAYNNGVLVRLRGALDVERLSRALNSVVARHEAWRTVFGAAGEGLVLDAMPIALGVRACEPTAVVELAQRDESERFDVEHGPLIRAVLYRLGADDHALLFVAHHIICDGWTVRLAMAELAELYAGRELSRPPVPYREFASRQREWLKSAEAEAQRTHWARELAGCSPSELASAPADAIEVRVPVDADVTARARAHGATEFAAHVSALATVLLETSGAPEVVIGTPMHNREHARDKQVFGCCVNLQPLRIRDASLPAVWEVCRRAQQTQALCVFSNVAPVKPRVVFELLDREHAPALQGLDVSLVPLPRTLSRHEIHVVARPGSISILYRRSGNDPARMEALARAFAAQLGSIDQGPGH